MTRRFEHHIFICANTKAPGKVCCGETHGLLLVDKFREELEKNGLKGSVRAQRSGCLDACKFGTSLVIYPEGTFYGSVGIDDVAHIVSEHLVHGRIVKKHLLQWGNQD